MLPPPLQCAPEPFSPVTLGPITSRNRIIKAATFEGMTPQRLVTDDLIQFHRRVAAGGVGMCTVAYCAVSPEGGTDGRQILLRDEAVAGLRRLTDAIHAEGAAAAAQLGNLGRHLRAPCHRSHRRVAGTPIRGCGRPMSTPSTLCGRHIHVLGASDEQRSQPTGGLG